MLNESLPEGVRVLDILNSVARRFYCVII